MKIRRVASLRTPKILQEYMNALDISLPFDETVLAAPHSPLAQPYQRKSKPNIGNRFAVLPMEGWDANTDGTPSELVKRRWQRFGESGAKLIWGCEAIAVRPDARANPNQLIISPETVDEIAKTRALLVAAHEAHFETSDDLVVGAQLTHSGRFCRPHGKHLEPQILYSHPLLNTKFGLPIDKPVMTDDDIAQLVDDFIAAAKLAHQAGFDFVDIKHCHGYLGHEFLTAFDRSGRYGGSFENRTRFLREVVTGIRAEVADLEIGVRLSAFDFIPFQSGDGEEKLGIPTPINGDVYRYAFGADETGLNLALAEPIAFLNLLQELGIELVCITGGSPYYTPHLIRPALFPPSDGYQPPEDPLVGVARHIATVAELKKHQPNLIYVGSGYSYLQDWFPNIAQSVIQNEQADFVGIGRMVLSYPDICADILAGRPLQRKRICRTFSDCTTAPRNHIISGCYPLDDFYKNRPEFDALKLVKAAM